MKLSEYVKHDATGLAALVNAGEVTPLELTRLARAAHDEVNPRINAVIEFYEDAETVASANGGPFHGVPFFRKDIGYSEAGRLQEMGSRLFKGNRATVESHFFRRARAAGLRPLGRTTTPEFGTSGASESLLHGITRNPWDLARSTGGSSCGSAAAVAAGISPIAHGSDGGGSIRIPAAWCGLVGLNPSRGRISGGPASQDASLGISREFVLCKSVRDMAAALDVFAGPEPGDPFIIVQPQRPYVQELAQKTGKLRIGVARTPWGEAETDPEIRAAVDSIAVLLERMGHAVTEIGRPFDPEERGKIGRGRRSLTAMLDHAARGMGRNVADTVEPVNLMLYQGGKDTPAMPTAELMEALRSMRCRVGEAIAAYDILLTPTMTTLPVRHEDAFYRVAGPAPSIEELSHANNDAYQYLGVFNVSGHPSVSLPLAQSSGGLPIGIQIVGRFGGESTLVRVARDLEEARPWAQRRPPVLAGSTH